MLFGDIVGESEQEYNYYIGEWKNNLRNGKGILCYKDGRIYIGDFINDKANGYGKKLIKMVNII